MNSWGTNHLQPIWIVATEMPSLRGGAPVRNFNLIKQLSAQGYPVRVFCIEDSHSTTADLIRLREMPHVTVQTTGLPVIGPLRSLWAVGVRRIIPYMAAYRRSELGAMLLRALETERPAVIQLEQLNGYYAAGDIIARFQAAGSQVVLDAHNIEQAALRLSLSAMGRAKRLATRYLLPHFSRLEDAAALQADAVLTCSDTDAKYFRQLGCATVYKIANGVDLDYFQSLTAPAAMTLLFMGGTSYPPNEEALQWYLTQAHPEVKAAVPNVQLFIIGSRPPAWLSRVSEADPSIVTCGYVEDVRDYLLQSAVCISPIQSGSGTSLKMLEYMAAGRPVVSTTAGARGLDYQPGRDICIADTHEAFADAIIALLSDKTAQIQIGRQARRLVQHHYDWQQIGLDLSRAYTQSQATH